MKLARIFVGVVLVLAAFAAQAMDPGFDRLEKELRLKPGQKEQYDAAVGATKRALLGLALFGMQAKQQVEAELQKSRPDLAALARAQEDFIDQARPLFREAGDEWMKLYALLDDDQAAIAKSFVEERLGRLLR